MDTAKVWILLQTTSEDKNSEDQKVWIAEEREDTKVWIPLDDFLTETLKFADWAKTSIFYKLALLDFNNWFFSGCLKFIAVLSKGNANAVLLFKAVVLVALEGIGMNQKFLQQWIFSN